MTPGLRPPRSRATCGPAIVFAAWLVVGHDPAQADHPVTLAALAALHDAEFDDEADLPDDGVDDFGRLIEIEAIEIVGNDNTSARVIRQALPFAPGDRIAAGSRRLRDARFKVLALGYFRRVKLAMRRGSARGRVIVEITVEERGTLQLGRLWFGTSTSSAAWLGADLSDRNFLGSGVTVGAAGVYARHGAIDGTRDQAAGELRAAAAGIFGSRWGLGAALTGVRGSEPYRIAGTDSDRPEDFAAFSYLRLGGRVTASLDLTAYTQLSTGVRAERVHTSLPTAPTRTLTGGEQVPLDLHLQTGASTIATASVGLDRDTRRNPALPHSGDRLQLDLEGGVAPIAGGYHFAVVGARYERWWPLRRGEHAIGVRVGVGAALGDVPRFDRLHLGDLNRLVTPRALGLVLSAEPAPDLLGTRAEDEAYGDVGGSASVEFTSRLFRGREHIYAGDLFIAVGTWALASRPPIGGSGLPIDMFIDAGLRLDTEIGTFELTVANAFGRVAW